MNGFTHEVQVRLGIEVEDESVLTSHLSDDSDAPRDIEQAIVLAAHDRAGFASGA